MKKPKQNCTVVIETTLHQPGHPTERMRVKLAPTDIETARNRFRKFSRIVFQSGTREVTNRELAEQVAANIGDILKKHGKKVTAII